MTDQQYRFCLRCASPLVVQIIDGHKRLVCSATECSFVFYRNPAPAAGALVVEHDRLLLVQRAHEPRVGFWCIPAGFMEWNERPEETAVREVAEETGLVIRLTELFDVYAGSDDPRTNSILILYLAEATGGNLCAADDALAVAWFSFDALPAPLAFESHQRAIDQLRLRVRKHSTEVQS